MVDYKYAELFQKNSVDKQLEIVYDGGVLTNAELHQESFELTESICSEPELRFGCCEASQVKFKITSNIPMKNKIINIRMFLDGNKDNPFEIGTYKVFSDLRTADKRYREIIAYDAMYEIINADVSNWYNSLGFPMDMLTFRSFFVSYFGIRDVSGQLINDDMIVEETIKPSQLSGKKVLEAICEINGCFAKINRDGWFEFIELKQNIQGLYPANDLYPSDNLFPKKEETYNIKKNYYINCQYEDFVTKPIDKLQIRQSEDDIGVITGNGDNCYIVEDNFILYGKKQQELEQISYNLYRVIKDISYRPFEATMLGNPCLEAGDAVRLSTKHDLVESYILRRTIKGVQALKDTISADGEEEQSEKVNSVNSSIIQLRGKTNELERTVEETKATITDVESGLQSQITQTASEISSEVSRATQAEGQLNSRITQTESSITSEVSRATQAEGQLNSRITQTESSITSEVSRATQAEGNLSTRITQTATEVSSKVSKDSVISEINQSAEEVSIKAEKISLEGVTTINNKFWIDESGKMHCEEAEVKGTVNADTFVCWDTLKMGSTYYGQIATVLSVVVDNVTSAVQVIIDPDGVVNEAIANSLLVCQKGLETPQISNSGNNILFQNSSLLAGFYQTSFRPNSDYKDVGTLGTSGNYWSAIYSKNGAVSSSDKNVKEDISYMNDALYQFFNSLKPCTFKFKNGDRTHYGFISQDVEQSLIDNGMTAMDFAGFCKDVKTKTIVNENGEEEEIPIDGEYIYSLRYSEFIALNTHMIQKAHKKIEQQQREIDELKSTVSFLMEKIERLGV